MYKLTALIVFLFYPSFVFSIEYTLKQISSGFVKPVSVIAVPGINTSLLVLEEQGKVIEFPIETPQLKKTFLDLSLLGGTDSRRIIDIAFHPKFSENGRVFVSYWVKSKANLSLVISEFSVQESIGTVDVSSEKAIIKIPLQFESYEGGGILFDADGMLLIGVADGGGKNDPKDNSQNPQTLFGKILRIDINKGDRYGVPDSNPFVTKSGGTREVFAWGLHNPHHLAIDKITGVVIIAERGQGGYEEVNILKRGANYGWSIYEGSLCLRMQIDCMNQAFKKPLAEYEKSQGSAIAGGLIYRGSSLLKLDGAYLYADQVSGNLWALTWKDQALLENKLILETKKKISALGEDNNGEAYLVDYESGDLYKLVEGAN